jgi:hypothetical protein
MHSLSKSVILVPFLQWMAAFRSTTNYRIPQNTWEGHSFMQNFSVTKHYTFHSRNWRFKVRATQGLSSNWHQELS